MDKAIKDLTAAIKMEKDGPEPYDTPAEVTRIEGNTAWVHIPGGIDETPAQLTISAEPGDTVQIRVAGGRAWITGNQSAPPTDDKVAKAARTTAAAAEAAAETAAVLSETAKRQAAAAAKIAGDTEQHFWFTETGADTGAHITEKTQEEFLQDPGNGGGNLLARSNGIALRDGLSEKLTITSSDITMGETSGQFLTQEPTGLLFGANTLYKARLQVDQPGIVIEDITTQQELRLGDAAFSFHLGDNNTAIYESSGNLHMIAYDDIIIDTNQGSGGRNITANGNITASGDITDGNGVSIADLSIDYITERGSSGNWKYIKYKSGRVVCEGYATFPSLTFSQRGSSYRSAATAFTIPNGIFTNAPTEGQAWIQSGSASDYFGAVIGSLTTTGGNCMVWKATSGNATNVSVHMRLVYR